jgi:hypothetical protein
MPVTPDMVASSNTSIKNAERSRWPETKSWIEHGVPDDDDIRATALTQPSVAGLDQLRSDTVPLDFGVDGHRPESATLDLADPHGAVQDVPHHSPVVDGHE